MKRRSAFEIYLRTGRRVVADPAETEVKFNAWHDPDDGRFTFAGQGRNYGGGTGAQARTSGPRSGAGRAAAVPKPSAVANARATTAKPLAAKPVTSLPPVMRTMGLPVDDGVRPQTTPQLSQPGQRPKAPKIQPRNAKPAPRRTVSEEPAQKFKQHMIAKEKDRNDVYPDNLGIPTVGIGHKVMPSDKLKLGDRISDARKEELWLQDSAKALQAAEQQMRHAAISDPGFFVALADVNFQLGPWWYKEHKETWALILRGDYQAAAREVKDSKWFRQTPDRVEAFRNALIALSMKQSPKKR